MAELTYLDFDICIEGEGGKYRAKVVKSPGGEAEVEFSLPLSVMDLDKFYEKVGIQRSTMRRIDSPEMEATKTFGSALFEKVFTKGVYSCLERSLMSARQKGKGIRLRLRVNSPELTNQPWEYLYDSRTNSFLSLSNETPVVRYLELGQQPRKLTVSPPIRVLAMAASPAGVAKLDVDRELNKLSTALQSLQNEGLVEIDRVQPATYSALQRMLMQGPYHIFHFIGHGKFDEQAQDGILLFEDDEGWGSKQSGQSIGWLLNNHRNLRLAILNACEAARTSREDRFSGVAHSLVQAGIPAVIAMQIQITDDAAKTFSEIFYLALAKGYPVEAAITEARVAIQGEGNDIEWGTPVYFTRTTDGRIFDIDMDAKVRAAKSSAPIVFDEDQEQQLKKRSNQAKAAFWRKDYDTARKYYQEIVRLNPEFENAARKLEDIEWILTLADLVQKCQQAEKEQEWRLAHETLMELIKHKESAGESTDDEQEKLAWLEKQIQLGDLYTEARDLVKSEHWQAVVNILDRIRNIDPDFKDSEELLAKAESELNYERGLNAMDAKNWEEANKAFIKAKEFHPHHDGIPGLLKRVHEELDKDERHERITILMEGAETAMGKESYTSSIKKLEEILKLDPDDEIAREKLLYSRDKLEEAAEISILVSCKPKKPEVHDEVTWIVTVHNNGRCDLRKIQAYWNNTLITKPFNLAAGKMRHISMKTVKYKTAGQKSRTIQVTAIDNRNTTLREDVIGIVQVRSIYNQVPDREKGAGELSLSRDVKMTLVRVPAGKFLMGETVKSGIGSWFSLDKEASPQHTVELSEYWIGKTPVTNKQYQAFMKSSNHGGPGYWEKESFLGKRIIMPKGIKNHPVVEVTWEDAVAFCEWLSKKTNKICRLPSEAEWEKAARGTDGRVYPWGKKWYKSKCNSRDSGIGNTTNVGKYSPQGDSPYGCADMAGNVWEWCADWYDVNEYENRKEQKVVDPKGPKNGKHRVVRGGSFYSNSRSVRCASRSRPNPYNRYWRPGFRVVVSPSVSDL